MLELLRQIKNKRSKVKNARDWYGKYLSIRILGYRKYSHKKLLRQNKAILSCPSNCKKIQEMLTLIQSDQRSNLTKVYSHLRPL